MICLDTMILIWGVQGAASSRPEMVDRTRRYIASLSKDRQRILIPAPAATEYLQFFDSVERQRQLHVLQRHFVIVPFDLPSAYLAADIAHKAGSRTGPNLMPRQCVKTDIQILATALAHSASELITDNKRHFASLAAGRPIKVREVPSMPEQGKLFEP